MQVNTNWRVLKFGGTSVASRAMWDNIFQITQAHLMEEQRESQRGDQQQRRVLLVCSAPSGVSNQLENLIEAAIKNDFTERFNQLRFQFEKLAQDLELSVTDETVQKAFDELWQYLVGVAALGEASPRSRAKIMAFGEMTLTQIAHQYLIHHRQACRFLDARTVLRAETVLNTSMHDQFLNAHCSYQADQTLQDMLNQGQERLVITQGFIAANSLGETVLLGRGGSDTSAAYFAAKMNAECLEIWTDVPGVYTANPAVIPEARLISELTYLEAQELASMGAKIMHPRCIEPVAKNNIPLWIKYTLDPSRHGTKIHNSGRIITGIKGVITKSGLVVLSIETLAMWHQVGFLADVFACFKKHGVSIDLISTSETMITVSLDQPQYAKTPALLDPVLHDLRAIQHAKVTCLTPCASISIVGQAIRACLSEFADVFELFKEQRIYLLSQAANDLNLSLIVDDEQAPRLAAQIHRELIERRMQPAIFKAAWREEFFSQSESRSDEKIWWMHEKNNLLALASKTPCYVYSKKMIADAANRLITQIPSVNRWWYAIKANSHPDVLTILADYDFGFECVSVGELERVFATLPSLDPSRVLFTPNFAPLAEYQRAFELGVHVTLDNLAVLREHGEIFSNRELILRVDLGQGHGHHRYVVTGGDQSKFGMAIADLPQAASLARQHGVRIKGLHTHAGSGIRDAGHWGRVLRQLSAQAPLFPELSILNLGGGLGVSDYPGGEILDLTALEKDLSSVLCELLPYHIWMEPGRYLVAEAGVLLTQVTQIKTKNEQQFIGVDTGMNSLIRPMLYGAYHYMVNLTRLGAVDQTSVQFSAQPVHVVGPICESGDVLGYNRTLGPTQVADIILISHAGAYGRSMSSCYNLREPASEFFLSN